MHFRNLYSSTFLFFVLASTKLATAAPLPLGYVTPGAPTDLTQVGTERIPVHNVTPTLPTSPQVAPVDDVQVVKARGVDAPGPDATSSEGTYPAPEGQLPEEPHTEDPSVDTPDADIPDVTGAAPEAPTTPAPGTEVPQVGTPIPTTDTPKLPVGVRGYPTDRDVTGPTVHGPKSVTGPTTTVGDVEVADVDAPENVNAPATRDMHVRNDPTLDSATPKAPEVPKIPADTDSTTSKLPPSVEAPEHAAKIPDTDSTTSRTPEVVDTAGQGVPDAVRMRVRGLLPIPNLLPPLGKNVRAQ